MGPTRALDRARPLAELPPESARAVEIIATDIDDTMTTHGRIPAATFEALWRARAAGLKVIPVTGRPAGWCDHIARMWPVDGVVGENGALWFRMDGGRMKRRWLLDDTARAANRDRLRAIGEEILREVPGAAISADQFCREFDLAIDFCEDVPALPREAVDRIVAIFERNGCTAKVSSIHVNGWFGEYDKKSMLAAFLAAELDVDADRAKEKILFAGDSPNDEPMFQHFPISVGVANIRAFADRIVHPPAFVSSREGGEGFAEIVDTLLARRA